MDSFRAHNSITFEKYPDGLFALFSFIPIESIFNSSIFRIISVRFSNHVALSWRIKSDRSARNDSSLNWKEMVDIKSVLLINFHICDFFQHRTNFLHSLELSSTTYFTISQYKWFLEFVLGNQICTQWWIDYCLCD